MPQAKPGNKKRRPTIRQRRLAKALPICKTQAEAGVMAGYADRRSTNRAVQTIEAKFPELMEKHGITDAFLIDKCLRPGLQATETKFFAHEGVVIDSRKVVAHGARHQYLETALKLKGQLGRNGNGDHDGSKSPALVINLGFINPERAREICRVESEGRTAGGLITVDVPRDENAG